LPDIEGSMVDPVESWDREYRRQGIPSSHRDEPSRALRWALSNLPYLNGKPPESAVDLGCGTGRNMVALRAAGTKKVCGVDFSATALKAARRRAGAEPLGLVHGDLAGPLPFGTASFDFAADIFVYFHQLSDARRAAYRREIHRILKPHGLLLVALATNNDGYYASCSAGPLTEVRSSIRLTWDPIAQVGNILPSYEQLLVEFADVFELQMAWMKRGTGTMHGRQYVRESVALIWRARH
jgi:SAM-dependent methyltransferase